MTSLDQKRIPIIIIRWMPDVDLKQEHKKIFLVSIRNFTATAWSIQVEVILLRCCQCCGRFTSLDLQTNDLPDELWSSRLGRSSDYVPFNFFNSVKDVIYSRLVANIFNCFIIFLSYFYDISPHASLCNSQLIEMCIRDRPDFQVMQNIFTSILFK